MNQNTLKKRTQQFALRINAAPQTVEATELSAVRAACRKTAQEHG